jgi:hypothetical protein
MPDTDICIILADYFAVSVDYLVGHSNIRTPLTEFAEYKLNPIEKSIIDAVRLKVSFDPDMDKRIRRIYPVLRKRYAYEDDDFMLTVLKGFRDMEGAKQIAA